MLAYREWAGEGPAFTFEPVGEAGRRVMCFVLSCLTAWKTTACPSRPLLPGPQESPRW